MSSIKARAVKLNCNKSMKEIKQFEVHETRWWVRKVTHCSANTRPHQLCWGDREMEMLSHARKAARWLGLFIHA